MSAIVTTDVVVLGAGVIGMTIALELVTSQGCSVQIVARDVPGEDMATSDWSSPWAGANWSPMRMGNKDTRLKRWEAETFKKMWNFIPAGRAKSLQTTMLFAEEGEIDDYLWFRDFVHDFAIIPAAELPAGSLAGIRFDTYSVNPNLYLPWLKSELATHNVLFTRRKLDSLDDAALYVRSGGVIINATSLGSRSLVGVQDSTLFPIRGQTILVYAPNVTEFNAGSSKEMLADNDHGHTEDSTYIIPRPGDGTVLLGGTFQEGNWDTSVDMDTARGILARCMQCEPKLKDAAIISHNVGLRPARRGGPRVEIERVQFPVQKPLELNSKYDVQSASAWVIHAYGFGPAGYQQSWGAAADVVKLYQEHVL